MRVAVVSTKPYDRHFLEAAAAGTGHELAFFEPRLTAETLPLAEGFSAVCAFVNDSLGDDVLGPLAQRGLRLIALRCAGFNNVDFRATERLGITVVRVPAYSPHAVAEHTIGMMLALNRKLHRAYARVRDGNFSLDGLLGFDLCGRTVGVIGTGKIGLVVIQILKAFGCEVLAFDPYPNERCEALGGRYVALEELYTQSDIITLHCPLSPKTHRLIDASAVQQMKPGVMLINTSRGLIVDTEAVVAGLKTGKIGWLAIDVYEEEADLFFEDLSNEVIHDDMFARLLTFPNVLVTGHQAFFTRDALQQIARTTLANISDIEQGRECPHRITAEMFVRATK